MEGKQYSPIACEEDNDLIKDACKGNEEAYARLFRKYRDRIYHFAFRFTRDKEISLDLCQDTFIKAFRSLGTFRAESSFSSWLFRIAYHTCIDSARSNGKLTTSRLKEELVDGESFYGAHRQAELQPFEKAAESEFREKLDDALGKLPDSQRSTFILHVIEELRYKDVAAVMNCSIGTVMSRLYYARRKLKVLLGHFMVSLEV